MEHHRSPAVWHVFCCEYTSASKDKEKSVLTIVETYVNRLVILTKNALCRTKSVVFISRICGIHFQDFSSYYQCVITTNGEKISILCDATPENKKKFDQLIENLEKMIK